MIQDSKPRKEFTIYYTGGRTRKGVLYNESNIKMDDGELYARLDQLVTNEVIGIMFRDYSLKVLI